MITIWLLGLAVAVLFVGGLGLDLWRAFETRRELAAVADAAAVAGASGLDTAAFRATGAVVLDPPAAQALAAARLAGVPGAFVVDARPEAVTVSGRREIPLTLVRVLLPDGPLTVGVTATAQPLRSP